MNAERNRDDIRAYVERWDAEGISLGLSMGGMGLGYDTAIQAFCIHKLRNLLTTEIPMLDDSPEVWQRLKDATDLLWGSEPWAGFTNNMVGAGGVVASQFWVYGLNHMLEKAHIECPSRVIEFKRSDFEKHQAMTPVEAFAAGQEAGRATQ